MLREGRGNPHKKLSGDQRSSGRSVPEGYRVIVKTNGERVHIARKVLITKDQIDWFSLRSKLDTPEKEEGNRSEWTGDWSGILKWHHIESRFFLICQGASPLIYNHFSNIIGVTEEEHIIFHPEDADISALFNQDRKEHARRLQEVNTRVLDGKPNWDTQYDEELREIAIKRSMRLLRTAPYPQSDGTKLTWSDCRKLF